MSNGLRKIVYMIRVGFVIDFDENWLGGVNYFRNLINAIYQLENRDLEIVIFTGKKTSQKIFEGFPPSVEIIRSSIFDRMSLLWIIRKLLHRLFSRSDLTELLLSKFNIDVLSHSSHLGKRSKIPAIGWIPDFQHLHLPSFFTAKELYSRNDEFGKLCKYCSKLILSSYSALDDLAGFDSNAVNKAAVLQFCIDPDNLKLDLREQGELEELYQFSGKYFLLPNQFWAHKNHKLVIEALSYLKSRGDKVLVLATGNINDYRQPHHYQQLMQMIKDLGVEDSFKILGLIPLSDLVALMKNAAGIINPSLFEGWSTTVEEAKLMGKNILLSDISVHREQNPLNSYYFHTSEPLALASNLKKVWINDMGEPPSFEYLYQTAKKNYLAFADNYQKIVFEVVQSE